MAPWTETPGSETRGAGAPPSTTGTPSTAYLNRARELAERVQASLESNVRHDALYAALASSPATETFAASRAKELMDELIAAGGDGGWRPAEATPARGGDRQGDDAARRWGGSSPRSPHPRTRDDDDDDPATPTPPGGTTNAGESTTPTAHPRTPSPTPPTPVDPIEALLSKAAARGADLPVVIVAGESDENAGREDDDRGHRGFRGRHGHHEQTPTPQQTPPPSAPNAAREKIRARRDSNPRPQGSPPIAFTPGLGANLSRRAADAQTRYADAQTRLDNERRRGDRLARKLTRAESRLSHLEDDFAKSERERRTMSVRYVALGERFDATFDECDAIKRDAERREHEHEALKLKLERRVKDLEAEQASTSASTSAEVARLRSELDAARRRERDSGDRATASAAMSAATSAEDRARIRELGDRCANLERELREAVAASVRAEAREDAERARRERLEASASKLEAEKERFYAERARQRLLAPAPTPGVGGLFDADADVATPEQLHGGASTDLAAGGTNTNLLARIVRTEVAEAVESISVDVAAREETNDRLRDAEGKLQVALEAARAAELAAARAGDADALIASLRERLERADHRAERAEAGREEHATKAAEAHERFAAQLRRDWEARLGEVRGDLANARAECERRVAEAEKEADRRVADAEKEADGRVADAEKEAARVVAEVRLESTRAQTQAEARVQISETHSAAARSEAEREANRARDLEAGFERRLDRIERDHRAVLAEKDRELVRKDAEVSNHLARLHDARAHGDRLERRCLDMASALKDAEAKASRCDELERATSGTNDARTELEKTNVVVAEVRANLNAAVEREKDAERKMAEALRDADKARAEASKARADHERETNALVAGHAAASREKDAEVKNLRDKAEDASARASVAEGKLAAVNEELGRVRRELDRRAGDIKRHEAEIERRRDDVIRAENETRRAGESLLVARADEAKTGARLEAVERERDAALAAAKAAREEAMKAVERAEREARDWRDQLEEATRARQSRAEEATKALAKAERATLERDGARERLKLSATELDAECARRRELEAVLRHVRDERQNELVAMRIQLNETKENTRAELARGWDAMRAELDAAQEQMARHANEQADAKAAAVLVDLDAQLAASKAETKAVRADLALALAECDAKETARRADKIRSDARKELEMEEVRRDASTAGKLEGHAGLRREIEALERERDEALAEASTARLEAKDRTKALRDELEDALAKHSEAIEMANDFKLRLREAQTRVRELEEGVRAGARGDLAASPPRSAYKDIQSKRERPTFTDRDDDRYDDRYDDPVPPVTSVEQAVEIIRTDRVALHRAEERASKAEYAAAAATARADEADGALERLKRGEGEDESPAPPQPPPPPPPPFVPPVKPIGDSKKMMSRLFHRLEHSGSPTPSEKDEARVEELERKKKLGEWTPADDDWRCESEELNRMTAAALRRRCVELELTTAEALEAAHDAEMRAELATQRALRAERKLVEARDLARAAKAAAEACFVELWDTPGLMDSIGGTMDSIRARFEDEVRAVEARLEDLGG